MKSTLRDFTVPLRATGMALFLGLIVGIVGGTVIYREKISDRKKIQRIELLGRGVGIMASIAVAPFWLVAAARIGKRRRAARRAE